MVRQRRAAMKYKTLGTLFSIFFLSVCLVFPANADKERVQKVLKKVDVAEKVTINTLEEGQKVYRAGQKAFNGIKKSVNSAVSFGKNLASGNISGAFSSATDFADSTNIPGLSENMDAIQTNIDEVGKLKDEAGGLASKANGLVKGSMDKLTNTVPSMFSNVSDIKQTEEDVDREYISQYGVEEEDINVFNTQQEKLLTVQRENIASLYARALAARVDITEEKASTPVEIDSTTARSLINATRDVAMRTAVRLKRIYELESAIYEYETMAATRKYMLVDSTSPVPASSAETDSVSEEAQ